MNPSETKLDAVIEAILFYKNEPVSLKKLIAITGRGEPEVREAIGELRKRLESGGISIVAVDDEYSLGTSINASALIEKMAKDDLAGDLGTAAVDTLTIVLYYGPVTKSRIDEIRGVNSSSMLRNLLVRGLVSREVKSDDQRSYLYKPTIELISYLGIKEISELPEYQNASSRIQA